MSRDIVDRLVSLERRVERIEAPTGCADAITRLLIFWMPLIPAIAVWVDFARYASTHGLHESASGYLKLRIPREEPTNYVELPESER